MTPEEAWAQVRAAEKALLDPAFAAHLMRTPTEQTKEEIERRLASLGKFNVDHVVHGSGNTVTVVWSHQNIGVVETTVIGTGPGFY